VTLITFAEATAVTAALASLAPRAAVAPRILCRSGNLR